MNEELFMRVFWQPKIKENDDDQKRTKEIKIFNNGK